jgi:hypothetical protein
MAEALREKRYDYKYVLGAGAHANDNGGALLPDALRWLWRDAPQQHSKVASRRRPWKNVFDFTTFDLTT